MLNPRLPVARPLALSLWLGSIAAVGIWGCQGPDTFLRMAGGGLGTGGLRNGVGGNFGIGGHGIGGTIGTGGTATGTGGQIGTGGGAAGGMTGSAGMTGTGGARDGGAETPATDGPTGTGGMIVVVDANTDVEGGVAGTGPCASFCSGTTPVTNFVVSPGHDFHSPTTVSTGEVCFATTSTVGGANCSNFSGRTLTVNGVAQPNCGTNFTPTALSGGYCFQFSPGTPDFAAIAVF